MLTIRLSRIGKRKKPMYRLIVSEKARDPYGRALEILGSYNPFSKDLDVKKDRIEHWINQGSQMSATVNNLLVEKGIIKGDKVTASKQGKKKKAKKESAEGKKKGASPEPGKKEEKPKKEEKKEEAKAEEVKES